MPTTDRAREACSEAAHNATVIHLPAAQVKALPVDELGLVVLQDLIASNAWNERNYLLEAQEQYGRHNSEVIEAIAEATSWLRSRALLALAPNQSASEAIFVTRAGRRMAAEGPRTFYATDRLQGSLHHDIERAARPQFLLGEYELAVFAAMRAVEIRVRKLANLDERSGVDLMNHAFRAGGPLADPTAGGGDVEGVRALFSGAYSVLRNPVGHREVNYEDVFEAAEAVQTASLIMRILDRVERRLSAED